VPTALTFTSLQEDLRHYLERGEITDTTVYAQLPRLINNAEREIAQDLKILGFIDPMISTLVAGTSVYAKPDRWRQTVSMNFGVVGSDLLQQNKRNQLYPRSYEYSRQYWPDSDVRAQPKFYTDYQYTHWLIVPTPVIDYPWEVLCWQLPALLDAVNQTNWLTDYAPSTLLYRCLLECIPFLKQDERTATFKPMYDESKSALNIQDLRRIADRNTARESN
jgi:hypothetical protein